MATLNLNIPDLLLESLQKSARESGRSIEEEAQLWLNARVDPEHILLEEIRNDRRQLASEGIFVTQADLQSHKQEGRE